MNPTLTEMHSAARRAELIADARRSRSRAVSHTRIQRRTRVAQADTTTLASRLGLGWKRRVVQAHAT